MRTDDVIAVDKNNLEICQMNGNDKSMGYQRQQEVNTVNTYNSSLCTNGKLTRLSYGNICSQSFNNDRMHSEFCDLTYRKEEKAAQEVFPF